MSKAMRQMPGQPGRVGVARGEARRDPISDEASGPPREHPGTGSAKQPEGTGGLLEAALTRQNLHTAWKRVKANKGAAGVDGLSLEQTAQQLRQSWPEIRQALLAGSYRPSPVRKVMIPKPDGCQRELGNPSSTPPSANTATGSGRAGVRTLRSRLRGRTCRRANVWWWTWTWPSSLTGSTTTS